MRKPLTARQQEIYGFIVEEIRQRGIPPTIREIGDRFGMRSSNGAREALNALARKGYIRRHDRLSRGIELVDPIEFSERISTGRQIPLIKHLQAGVPQIAQAAISRYIVVDSSFLPSNGTLFAIVVPDNALQASGFWAGDIAIAATTPPYADGDVVVVLMGSRLLVRRYHMVDSVAALETDRAGDKALLLGVARPEIHLIGQVYCLLRNLEAGGV